ncbi:MAG: DUF2867 domain-containing protein [Anaerolineae bacterium]|nr:DUF2867 domain-containing protein [Anaerolineae bacterium]
MALPIEAEKYHLPNIPEITALYESADHIDVKTTESQRSFREFVAGLLSYQPAWLTALYGIRWGFVRLLGMKQDGIPQAKRLTAEEVSMSPGTNSQFMDFKVIAAQEDAYWFAQASESHLTATVGVIQETLPNRVNRFHVVTVVHYNKWTGRVYFNTIRPFHHLVVGAMMNQAVKAKPAL